MPSIICPGQFAAGANTFSHAGKHYMVLTMDMIYDPVKKRPLVSMERANFTSLISNLMSDNGSLVSYIDESRPKLQGEWLVYGVCRSPQLQKTGAAAVSVQLGDAYKQLAVFGPRKWVRNSVGGFDKTDPEKVEAVPILYPFAFGGEGYKNNPEGRVLPEGEALPQIEDPKALVGSKKDAPKQPAGMARIPNHWGQRSPLFGTMDEKWAKFVQPAHPDDFSWEYFLSAPKDQRIPKFFTGAENFELTGFKESGESWRGKLPGYRARAFYTAGDSLKLIDISPQLDTVILYPDQELIGMVWRGVIEVSDHAGAQIEHMVGAYETEAESDRDIHYYQKDFNWRLPESEYDSLYHTMVTGPLIPKKEISAQRIAFEVAQNIEPDPGLMRNMEELERGKERMRDALGARGQMDKMTDSMAQKGQSVPIASSLRDNIKGRLDQVRTQLDKMMPNQAEEKLSTILENLDDTPKAKNTFKPTLPNTPEFNRLVKRVEAIIPRYLTDPMNINADHQVRRNVEAVQAIMQDYHRSKQLQALNAARSSIEQQIKSLEGKERVEEQLKVLYEARDSIIAQINEILYGTKPPKTKLPRALNTDSMDPGDMGKAHEELTKLVGDFSENMSGLPAKKRNAIIQGLAQIAPPDPEKGENLVDALAEGATRTIEETFFQGYRRVAGREDRPGLSPHSSKTREMELTQEVLDRYAQGERDFSGMDLACLDFSGKNFEGAVFRRCYLEQTSFKEATLTGCDFSQAIVVRTDFTKANLKSADFTDANYSRVVMADADLRGARMNTEVMIFGPFFQRARMENAAFYKLFLEEASFKGSKMNGTRWEWCNIDGATFEDADFTSSSFSMSNFSSVLADRCKFEEAKFERVTFHLFFFNEANFRRATFEASSLSQLAVTAEHGTTFEHATFDSCSLGETGFLGTSFKFAKFIDSAVDNATFEHCNFDGASMPELNLSKVSLRHNTFRYANMMGADLSASDLRNTKFTNANLHGANFTHVILGETDFTDANLKRTILEDWRPS